MLTDANGFTPKQQAVIDAIATAPSLSQSDAARQSGLHKVTITRWKRDVPAFASAIEQAREQGRQRLLRAGEARMAELLPEALEVLEQHLGDEDPRIRAQAALAIVNRTVPRPPERHELSAPEGSSVRYEYVVTFDD